MTTTAKKQQNWLVKRYHALCSRLGMSAEDRAVMLAGYGAASSLDLSAKQLQEVCDRLDGVLHPRVAEADTWRKRVMAAIGGWLRMLSKEQNAAYIRSIACRCTGHDSFNDIPVERLRNVYYAFVKKQKDFRTVDTIAADEMDLLTYQN